MVEADRHRGRSCSHGGKHAICEVPPRPETRTRAHYPHPCLWACTPFTAIERRAGPPAPQGLVPATLPLCGPLSPRMCPGRCSPFGLGGAPRGRLWLPGLSPATVGLRGGIQEHARALRHLAPLVARLAVFPVGPAACRYDARDDLLSPRALGCMHQGALESRHGALRLRATADKPATAACSLPRTRALGPEP